MSEPDRKKPPMSWPVIIAITAATAVVTGVVLGVLAKLGVPTSTAGVGAATGVVGALLISGRRRAG